MSRLEGEKKESWSFCFRVQQSGCHGQAEADWPNREQSPENVSDDQTSCRRRIPLISAVVVGVRAGGVGPVAAKAPGGVLVWCAGLLQDSGCLLEKHPTPLHNTQTPPLHHHPSHTAAPPPTPSLSPPLSTHKHLLLPLFPAPPSSHTSTPSFTRPTRHTHTDSRAPLRCCCAPLRVGGLVVRVFNIAAASACAHTVLTLHSHCAPTQSVRHSQPAVNTHLCPDLLLAQE